ncbi:MAG: hypothetical protein JW791_05305 [Nanoarchaeota archaeon]|nr:hypothetical protein [Nanoarchaeota archaeon]
MSDALIIFIVLIYVFSVIIFSMLLYYNKLVSSRTCRNMIHLLTGLSIFSLFYVSNKYFLLLISVLMTVLLFMSGKKTPILKHLYSAIAEKEEGPYLQGPLLYGFSITILITYSIITGNNIIPVASALVMIISDPVASFIGKRYGRHKIFLSYTGTVRSVEGSIAMLASNIIILSIFFSSNWTIVIISFFITIAELVSVSKADDLILPLTTVILLTNSYM